jgi:alkaline phosphatase
LFNALRNKAFTIEADVYPGDSLFVAHDKKDIQPGKTLVSMYLQPIIKLFATHNGSISDDTAYAPTLMIDIKENSYSGNSPSLLICWHRTVMYLTGA